MMFVTTAQSSSVRELVAVAAAVAIFMTGIYFIAWWKIFSKAGYSGARSLLLIFPLVNLIVFLLFAFSEWPIQRRLRGVDRPHGDRGY